MRIRKKCYEVMSIKSKVSLKSALVVDMKQALEKIHYDSCTILDNNILAGFETNAYTGMPDVRAVDFYRSEHFTRGLPMPASNVSGFLRYAFLWSGV